MVERENDNKAVADTTTLLQESMSFRSSNDLSSNSMAKILNAKITETNGICYREKPKSNEESSAVPHETGGKQKG